VSDIERRIEASSLGTPDAVAMRERTTPEQARRVMARAKEIAADEEPTDDGWFEEFLDAVADANVRMRFWVCPVREHRGRNDAQGWPVVTVEWHGDVAHCTAPGCGRTSVDR
jgi:hypothetical protein